MLARTCKSSSPFGSSTRVALHWLLCKLMANCRTLLQGNGTKQQLTDVSRLYVRSRACGGIFPRLGSFRVDSIYRIAGFISLQIAQDRKPRSPVNRRRRSPLANLLNKTNIAHGQWQIARWDSQRNKRDGWKLAAPGQPCHEGNSRGRQASRIERMGARHGPPTRFASAAVGHPFSVAPPVPSGPFRK
jgi:hypothetical protein